MTEAEHAVPLAITLLFAALLAALIVCLALEEKIHAKKSIIVACFSVVSLLMATFLGGKDGLLPFGEHEAFQSVRADVVARFH